MMCTLTDFAEVCISLKAPRGLPIHVIEVEYQFFVHPNINKTNRMKLNNIFFFFVMMLTYFVTGQKIYVWRTVDSTCISNNKLLFHCNILSVEQGFLALANNWWRKAFDNNDYIINFTYYHQTNTNIKTSLNINKNNRFL